MNFKVTLLAMGSLFAVNCDAMLARVSTGMTSNSNFSTALCRGFATAVQNKGADTVLKGSHNKNTLNNLNSTQIPVNLASVEKLKVDAELTITAQNTGKDSKAIPVTIVLTEKQKEGIKEILVYMLQRFRQIIDRKQSQDVIDWFLKN